MVTGGVASVIYGDPRFTRDIDIVLRLRTQEIVGLVAAFAGDEPDSEALREWTTRLDLEEALTEARGYSPS